MGQRRQPGGVQRREQEAAGDANGLGDIVMLDVSLRSVGLSRQSVVDAKDDDQARRDFEEVLAPVRAERPQHIEPVMGRPLFVKRSLFLFRGHPDLPFDVGIPNDDEAPRLEVGARRRGPGDRDRLVDDGVGHRLARVVPHSTATDQPVVERPQARDLLVGGEMFERERYGLVVGFGHGLNALRATPHSSSRVALCRDYGVLTVGSCRLLTR